MTKPYVICHMASTIDGRIITEHWGGPERKKAYSALYEQCHNHFEGDAWMCGRVTLEKDFTKGRKPVLKRGVEPIARVAFVGDKDAESFAIAVDPGGKLGWEENHIGGDHIISILTESVGDEYLQYLLDLGISYFFAGPTEIDFAEAMTVLADLFPIKTVLLEGGGHINGSMLQAAMIDELSLLLLPIADGSPDTATTFDLAAHLPHGNAVAMKLTGFQRLDGDVLWLRYTI